MISVLHQEQHQTGKWIPDYKEMIYYFRRDGGPRGDGGNRGGYRESRDENFNRGGGRDRQWNDRDGGRDGDRPQRQNNDYQRGKISYMNLEHFSLSF